MIISTSLEETKRLVGLGYRLQVAQNPNGYTFGYETIPKPSLWWLAWPKGRS